ncbi:MAG: hypothetical protein HOB84_01510 [Candidatus Marinimicrobia bacterium]|jgi:hypothetical protein|nr:hypothetical protein [Candidatus Neomarinimicrobiota bacterium]MBT4362639.1 hypothetical protein [Candidatus Neomarinimicrobiota bacterium]MBT4713430.1 hypothetical protein [Candidatus Neomarinimicrobiota bacterium]MBT4944600.1 hypothetical protein [Candidatus Neomarinimicrobiota bacterium]MBT5270662.1 hypothetical protein [Candidatus Neomarinimicrobiota bacterium]
MSLTLRIFVVLSLITNLSAQDKICEVKHKDIDEQSAIIKSQTYDNVYWLCNDSGDKPFVFPVTEQGKMIVPDFMKKRYIGDKIDDYPGIKIKNASLIDWEAMSVLNDTLVIGDVGNNGNTRRDMGVYIIPEPNPRATYETRPLLWLPVRYEDQSKYPADEWEFDCESMFTFKGKIYFLTKHRADRHIRKPAPGTKLYRMDTRFTNKVNVLKLVNRKDDLGGWVTDASMAQDESAMVLIAQNPLVTIIWYFPKPKRGDDFLAQTPRSYSLRKADQAEGVCFKDPQTIIVTNEQREWFEIPLSAFSK